MLLAAAVVLTVGAIAFTLFIRERDLPAPVPRTGYEHLEERKSQIYENLRDLQFEYRVGKLSDADYQVTKQLLQTELAAVMSEIDKMKQQAAPPAAAKAAAPARAPATDPQKPSTVCQHCGAQFPTSMKFCGECGKAMSA
jgi:hypothetical protein